MFFRQNPVERLEPNDVPPSIRLQNAWRSELTIEGGLPQPGEGRERRSGHAAEEADAKAFPDLTKVFRINYGFGFSFTGSRFSA